MKIAVLLAVSNKLSSSLLLKRFLPAITNCDFETSSSQLLTAAISHCDDIAITTATTRLQIAVKALKYASCNCAERPVQTNEWHNATIDYGEEIPFLISHFSKDTFKADYYSGR